MTVRVAVVDDNWLYRNGLGTPGAPLGDQHDVVWRACDATDLLRQVEASADRRCDVVVLDLRVVAPRAPDPATLVDWPRAPGTRPIPQGVEAIDLVLRSSTELSVTGHGGAAPAIVVHTEVNLPRVHLACYLSGAAAVVHKRDDPAVLATAIDAAAAGEVLIGPETAALAEELAERVDLNLTQAEAKVLVWHVHGLSNKQIATQLTNSKHTVSNHLRHIRDKFGPDLPLDVLANSFGLLDLAPPDRGIDGGAPEFSRPRLKALVRRLKGTDARRS